MPSAIQIFIGRKKPNPYNKYLVEFGKFAAERSRMVDMQWCAAMQKSTTTTTTHCFRF